MDYSDNWRKKIRRDSTNSEYTLIDMTTTEGLAMTSVTGCIQQLIALLTASKQQQFL
jgi:hypothetical protein